MNVETQSTEFLVLAMERSAPSRQMLVLLSPCQILRVLSSETNILSELYMNKVIFTRCVCVCVCVCVDTQMICCLSELDC